MKVALCCIGRLENQYAREFVEHYKKLKFDKIFIYDNNHDGEEHFEDVLQDLIDDGLVEIIDCRNKEKYQLTAYNDCYQKHKDEYDWFAFFDFDEFLIIRKNKKIKSFLAQFDNYNCVLLNWMVMDDNNIILNDKTELMKRFTHPMDYNKCITYAFPENNHVKCIVRGGIDKMIFNSTPHVPSTPLECCDALGKKCSQSPFKNYTFEGAYIKHFATKTIDEWHNIKMKRGLGDRKYETFLKSSIKDNFFKYNEKTKEKENFINSLEINLNILICAHKDFIPKVSNKAYKIVYANKINYDVTKNGLKDNFYSELYQFKFVNDNVINLPKYIGFCHYRRYFSFLNDIPNMDELFEKYDCIVAKPLEWKNTIREQYAKYHNIEDLNIVEKIIDEKYPEYSHFCKVFLDGKIFVPYNMFIMKREDFKKYCNFAFGVLDEYINIVGTDINKRIEDNKDKYLKDFYPNNTIEYQYRIGGYLAERLTNIFLMNNFKKMKIYPVIITEEKYNNKKEQKI